MREYLLQFMGEEAAMGVQFMVALLAVLLLFGVFVWFLRLITGKSRRKPAHQDHRLAVLDRTQIDDSRSLLLVRRDDVEHLVMIGGPSDVVVESNIGEYADDPDRGSAQSLPGHEIARRVIAQRPLRTMSLSGSAASVAESIGLTAASRPEVSLAPPPPSAESLVEPQEPAVKPVELELDLSTDPLDAEDAHPVVTPPQPPQPIASAVEEPQPVAPVAYSAPPPTPAPVVSPVAAASHPVAEAPVAPAPVPQPIAEAAPESEVAPVAIQPNAEPAPAPVPIATSPQPEPVPAAAAPQPATTAAPVPVPTPAAIVPQPITEPEPAPVAVAPQPIAEPEPAPAAIPQQPIAAVVAPQEPQQPEPQPGMAQAPAPAPSPEPTPHRQVSAAPSVSTAAPVTEQVVSPEPQIQPTMPVYAAPQQAHPVPASEPQNNARDLSAEMENALLQELEQPPASLSRVNHVVRQDPPEVTPKAEPPAGTSPLEKVPPVKQQEFADHQDVDLSAGLAAAMGLAPEAPAEPQYSSEQRARDDMALEDAIAGMLISDQPQNGTSGHVESSVYSASESVPEGPEPPVDNTRPGRVDDEMSRLLQELAIPSRA